MLSQDERNYLNTLKSQGASMQDQTDGLKQMRQANSMENNALPFGMGMFGNSNAAQQQNTEGQTDIAKGIQQAGQNPTGDFMGAVQSGLTGAMNVVAGGIKKEFAPLAPITNAIGEGAKAGLEGWGQLSDVVFGSQDNPVRNTFNSGVKKVSDFFNQNEGTQAVGNLGGQLAWFTGNPEKTGGGGGGGGGGGKSLPPLGSMQEPILNFTRGTDGVWSLPQGISQSTSDLASGLGNSAAKLPQAVEGLVGKISTAIDYNSKLNLARNLIRAPIVGSGEISNKGISSVGMKNVDTNLSGMKGEVWSPEKERMANFAVQNIPNINYARNPISGTFDATKGYNITTNAIADTSDKISQNLRTTGLKMNSFTTDNILNRAKNILEGNPIFKTFIRGGADTNSAWNDFTAAFKNDISNKLSQGANSYDDLWDSKVVLSKYAEASGVNLGKNPKLFAADPKITARGVAASCLNTAIIDETESALKQSGAPTSFLNSMKTLSDMYKFRDYIALNINKKVAGVISTVTNLLGGKSTAYKTGMALAGGVMGGGIVVSHPLLSAEAGAAMAGAGLLYKGGQLSLTILRKINSWMADNIFEEFKKVKSANPDNTEGITQWKNVQRAAQTQREFENWANSLEKTQNMSTQMRMPIHTDLSMLPQGNPNMPQGDLTAGKLQPQYGQGGNFGLQASQNGVTSPYEPPITQSPTGTPEQMTGRGTINMRGNPTPPITEQTQMPLNTPRTVLPSEIKAGKDVRNTIENVVQPEKLPPEKALELKRAQVADKGEMLRKKKASGEQAMLKAEARAEKVTPETTKINIKNPVKKSSKIIDSFKSALRDLYKDKKGSVRVGLFFGDFENNTKDAIKEVNDAIDSNKPFMPEEHQRAIDNIRNSINIAIKKTKPELTNAGSPKAALRQGTRETAQAAEQEKYFRETQKEVRDLVLGRAKTPEERAFWSNIFEDKKK